MTRVRN